MGTGSPGIQLALMLMPGDSLARKLAVQLGVTHAIVDPGPLLRKLAPSEFAATLAALREEFERDGMKIAGLEGSATDFLPMDRIKLGLPGRDEELEAFLALVEAAGKVGIPMICYDFMAGLGWYRTRVDVPERGGALVSEFDYAEAERQGLTRWGVVPEEKIWENFESFLKAVVPVAEQAKVKLALHPDDPPVSPLRGIGRIFTCAAAFRRALELAPSPVNGIAFCQANFRLMGEDLESLVREWCGQGKVFFVHCRDVRGDKYHFRETFHDNGPTDMARMLRVYAEAGFRGPLRPDHAPTLAGEQVGTTGYGMLGRLCAISYIRGLMHGQGLAAG